ncbi:Threonine--tRNA ligase, mitochondrial 1 [Linum perenne]
MLDFQLSDRFELEYSAEDEAKLERPVMIHRAILGFYGRYVRYTFGALQGEIHKVDTLVSYKNDKDSKEE